MKKYLKFLIIAIIAIAITSCSQDDVPQPNEPEIENELETGKQKWLLVEEKINGRTNYAYEYNEYNKMVVSNLHLQDGPVISEYFAYNMDGNLIRAEAYSDGEFYMVTNYYYESGDKPAYGAMENVKGVVIQEYYYSYEGNTMTYKVINNSGTQTYIFTFDDDGNLLTIEGLGNGHFNCVYGDYDNKAYRYTSHPYHWLDSSVNNARYFKEFVGGPLYAPDEEVWDFTYNDDGYPISAEVRSREDNQVIANYTYTYVKANKIN